MRTLKRVLTVSTIALASALAWSGAQAAVVTYTDFTAFQAATSSLTLESFETAPWTPEGLKTQPVVNLGVSWTAANNLRTDVIPERTGNTAVSSIDDFSGDQADEIVASFLNTGITAVGVWMYNFNTTVRMELLDAASNSLGFLDLAEQNIYSFLGFTSDTDIAQVRMFSLNPPNNDDFTIDDFSFGQALAVPEPTSLLLLAGGLIGLGLRARRSIS